MIANSPDTTSPHATRPTLRRIGRLALVGLAALVGWLIYDRVIRPSGMMGWDQAGHALRALVLAQDVQARNWAALLYDIYRQVYWPPAHTVVLAGTFAAFGHTVLVGRVTSLAIFLVGAGVIYGCGQSLDRRRGAYVAFVATVLYLTAPALTPYAGQVMLEIPALCTMYLAVFIFLRLDGERGSRGTIWLGLAIVLAFLTKLNYGVLLVLVVGLELLIEARFRPRALFNRQLLYLALAVLVPLVIWFAYPPKLWRTWDALVNQPFGTAATFSTASLLFYPRALVNLCGSALLFAVFMAGLARAVWRSPHDRALRFLVLIVVVQVLIGQLHQTKVDRHLFPVLPALFLTTGSLCAHLMPYANRGRARLATNGLTVLLLLYSSWLFFDGLRPASTLSRPFVADEVAALIEPDRATLVLGTINLVRPVPPQLDWILAAEYDLMAGAQSDVAMNLEQDLSVVALAGELPGPAFVRRAVAAAAGRSRAPAVVRTVYIGLSDYTGYSQSPAALQRFLQAMQRQGLFDQVIVIMPIDPTQAFVPIGQAPYAAEFVTAPLEALGLKEQMRQRYADVNVEITVYE